MRPWHTTMLNEMKALLALPTPKNEPEIKPPVLKYAGDPERHRMKKATVVSLDKRRASRAR